MLSCGVRRELFDRAIAVLLDRPGIFRSYDRIYVENSDGDR
jgi:hypothetical protein